MTVLGVDFGFKRIGLALTDTDAGLPSALRPMEASGSLKKDAGRIAEAARQRNAGAIVIGLPREMDGQEGRMARICRQLGGHLTDLGFVVSFVDETLTSVQAENTMMEAGVKASVRKRRRDGEAASLILERFLDESSST